MPRIQGSCLCGAVKFSMRNAFDDLFFCSCDQCKKISGSAFASNLFCAAGQFAFSQGQNMIKTYQVPGRNISKSFCKKCGCGVPHFSDDGKSVVVPAGTLSGEPVFAKRARIFTSEVAKWSIGLEDEDGFASFPEAK